MKRVILSCSVLKEAHGTFQSRSAPHQLPASVTAQSDSWRSPPSAVCAQDFKNSKKYVKEGAYDFYFNIEYVTRFNDQISHLHFSKISKYKIAKNSNTDSKLQIIFLLFLGWVGMEDIRKGCFCWLNKDQNERGIH